MDVHAFGSWMSAPRCLFFQDFEGLTVFAPGRSPGYPRGPPPDIRPQNLLFGLLFRSRTLRGKKSPNKDSLGRQGHLLVTQGVATRLFVHKISTFENIFGRPRARCTSKGLSVNDSVPFALFCEEQLEHKCKS